MIVLKVNFVINEVKKVVFSRKFKIKLESTNLKINTAFSHNHLYHNEM